jgi:hypothetical protein
LAFAARERQKQIQKGVRIKYLDAIKLIYILFCHDKYEIPEGEANIEVSQGGGLATIPTAASLSSFSPRYIEGRLTVASLQLV